MENNEIQTTKQEPRQSTIFEFLSNSSIEEQREKYGIAVEKTTMTLPNYQKDTNTKGDESP